MTDLLIQQSPVMLTCRYLKPALVAQGHSDVFVGKTIPAKRPNKMVIVKSIGGTYVQGVLAKSTFDISIFHTDEYEADQLSELVCALMLAADTNSISDCQVITRPTDVNPTGDGVVQRFMRMTILTKPL